MKNSEPVAASVPGRPGSASSGKMAGSFEESLPHLVWTAQPDGWVDFFNQKWFDYTGQKFQESAGWGWKEAVHWKDLKTTIDKWKQSIVSGNPFESEVRLQSGKDRKYRWYLLKACPTKDSGGKVVKWFGSFTDIDDQKKELENKDEFIGLASHELKTPLASIQAYVELLERSVDEKRNPEIRQYVEKAHRHIKRLRRLIADLLDVSEINAGKLKLSMSEFNFNDLLNETVEGFQATIKSHRILMTGNADFQVKADRARMDHLLMILLTNAIKFSPKANKIVVNVTHDRRNIMVSVTDFGIGIVPEKLKSIFNRFYRVNENKKFGGLGIGLYIAWEIVTRHKGRIWAESNPGEGSTFYFTIPYKKALTTREK